jgi:hypothetical protein
VLFQREDASEAERVVLGDLSFQARIASSMPHSPVVAEPSSIPSPGMVESEHHDPCAIVLGIHAVTSSRVREVSVELLFWSHCSIRGRIDKIHVDCSKGTHVRQSVLYSTIAELPDRNTMKLNRQG